MKKLLIGLFIVLGFILSYNIVYGYSVDGIESDYDIENTGYTPMLEQFNYNGRLYNSFYIPMWKVEIIQRYKLNYDYFVLLNVITNLECGKENGNCLGADNGPFQFNYIHKEVYRTTKTMLIMGKYIETYVYQLENMIGRINRFNKVCGEEGSRLWYRCQLGRHNGSGTNGSYAYKGMKIYDILSKDKYRLKELYNNYDIISKKAGFKYIPFLDENYTTNILKKEQQSNIIKYNSEMEEKFNKLFDMLNDLIIIL